MFFKKKIQQLEVDKPKPDTTTLSDKALSAKEYVLSIWPKAECSSGPIKAFWP